MLTWPHPQTDWAVRMKDVEPTFVEIARQVSLREKVLIACFDARHRFHIEKLLATAGVDRAKAILQVAPSNDTWARDHGPITVMCHDELTLLDFRFNGWGGKYPADLDNALTARLYRDGVFGDALLESVDLVLEGGSIEVDGSGTLLTTERCLLAPTRNPLLNREQIEKQLKERLGIARIIWLKHGYLAGDDTDGHVDTLARFCNPHTIAYVTCDDPNDEHYGDLKAMEQELKSVRAADGTPCRLVPLQLPSPRYDDKGRRLPATYANFLIINGAVLVPTYDDPADGTALERLASCFPGHEIIGLSCSPLIHQFGSLHCVTMQFPAGVL